MKAGWGWRTIFAGNRVDVGADGVGFEDDADTECVVIGCDNEVHEAGSGWANVPCTP